MCDSCGFVRVRIGRGHWDDRRRRSARDIGREHVRAHGDTLVGARGLLKMADGDTRRGEGVETSALVARVALGEAALDLEERGENDHHHHHRCHDGKRQNEGET